jgi:NTP pyrophosphatase (non-canonical NTP hydrolase)
MSARGHELARDIIAKHGRDRYPTPELAALKLAAEVGELASEILRKYDADPLAVTGAEFALLQAKIRKEYGDVGLTLHAVGNLLELDLDAEMDAVVKGETRTFA